MTNASKPPASRDGGNATTFPSPGLSVPLTLTKISLTSSLSSDDSRCDNDARSTIPEPILVSRKESQAASVLTEEVEVVSTGIGLLPDEVYDRALGSWRSKIRRYLTKSLVWESRAIAALQVSMQSFG